MSEFKALDIQKVLETIEDDPIEFCHIRTASYEIVFSVGNDDAHLVRASLYGESQVALEPLVSPETYTMPSTGSPANKDRRLHDSPIAVPQPDHPADVATGPDKDLVDVVSPMVGIFYSARDPESPPFVEVGSWVEEETTVGLIEAMKVFTSVPARVCGTVVDIGVENGGFVEYGAAIMKVELGSENRSRA